MMGPMAAKAPGKKRSLYDILGVPRDAMAIDIGMAYKRKLAEFERRADIDPNEAALVREAYHILCQPKEREAYDSSLITREEREEAKTQAAPDFMLDAGDDDPAIAKKKTMLWIGAAALAVLVILLTFAFTRSPPSDRAKLASERPAEDAKPVPPPPPPAPKKRTAAEVLTLAMPTVASVVAYDISGRPQPVGSGVVLAPDGIVTTCHALPPSATIVARIGNEQIPANLVIYDEDLNLCRLSVARLAVTPLAAGPDEPKAGDAVYAVAQHKPGEISVVDGTIKAVSNTPKGRFLELSMPVPPGASGGALFDAYGRLVGVLTSKPGGMNAAVPANAVAQMRTRGQPAPSQ
jgi:serine protease Do